MDFATDDPLPLGQLPKLPSGRRAADMKDRMRNLSESALRSRGIERPADPARMSLLAELQGAEQRESVDRP